MDAYEKLYNLTTKNFKRVYHLFLKLDRDNKNQTIINQIKLYGFSEDEIKDLLENQTYK